MDSAGTLPSFTTTVTNKKLTLGWDAGTLATKGAAVTVVYTYGNSIKAYIYRLVCNCNSKIIE